MEPENKSSFQLAPGAMNPVPHGATFFNQNTNVAVSGAQLKSELAAALKLVCDIISRAAAAGITLTFQLQTDPTGNSHISLFSATMEL